MASRGIGDFLWRLAQEQLGELRAIGQDALLVWDESVLEKAESLALEGLCAVRSTVAARLRRIKPGFYNPPGGRPVFVPGLNWLSVLLFGRSGAGVMVAMEWWTTRGKLTREKRSVEQDLLARLAATFGTAVVHIWDRGFAGTPWLLTAFDYQVRFVMRWPKRLKLLNAHAELLNAWKIARGKRSWQERYLWDARRQHYRKIGFLALPVAHPARPDQPLWLVISRQGSGRQPWYLLTNEPILTPDDAWRIILAYARRWQIEMTFRFSKAELALESPRLWFWDNRFKLLMMVPLVYAFLLSLLAAPSLPWLLRTWCHRTGQWGQDILAPLYRLRAALSRLWLTFPSSPLLNSG
jgi:hypothetical protein